MWFLSWKCILFILFMIFVGWAHFKFGNRQKYPFQGLSSEEIVETAIGLNDDVELSKKKKNSPKVNKFEERCRSILQSIYGCAFPSCRPDFLKSPVTKKNLEIDCYNSRLKLGLEYDGVQHAKYTPYFHKDDKWKFIYQVKKDDWKDMKCAEHGITLIRVPHYVPYDKLEQYIRKKLIRNGKL